MDNLVDPAEPLDIQMARLKKISAGLMRRVETQTDPEGAAYCQIESAVVLEDQVRRRTEELERALRLLNESNAKLSAANSQIEGARRDLASGIEAVQEGFALFGADDLLLLFNGRFCWQMPEVRAQLRPGIRFADYVQIVSRSAKLHLPASQTPRDWAATRMQRHRRHHVIFNLALIDNRWLQISEHRTANSGTAIVQTDVTDLMRAERGQRKRLLDNQGRIIRATLDHLAQGVAIFDAQSLLAGWNRRFRVLTGLPPQTFTLGTLSAGDGTDAATAPPGRSGRHAAHRRLDAGAGRAEGAVLRTGPAGGRADAGWLCAAPAGRRLRAVPDRCHRRTRCAAPPGPRERGTGSKGRRANR